MLIAIMILFTLYLTGVQKETNRQKHILKTRKAQKEPEKELITQETVNHQNLDCPHKFGYLQTQKNKSIPEECTGCTKLVQCLLPDK